MSNDPTAKALIRESNRELDVKRWGLTIVRCTYSSQEKWDKFMFFIKDDAATYLEDDKDLWETMIWTVIEDHTLDGADYMGASKRFSNWVDKELKVDELSSDELSSDEENSPRAKDLTWKEQYERSQEPRHRFFLYVDEASMNSVVDLAETNTRGTLGGYFIMLVCQYNIARREDGRLARKHRKERKAKGEELPGDATEEMDDISSDEEDSEYRRDFWQKFKAWDIVLLYAAIAQDCWPDFVEDNEEIGVILHLA